MLRRSLVTAVLAAACLLPLGATAQNAAPSETWVGAWGRAPRPQPPGLPTIPQPTPQPVPLGAAPPRPATPPSAPIPPLILNPGNLPVDTATAGDISNLTVRQAVRVAVGGPR